MTFSKFRNELKKNFIDITNYLNDILKFKMQIILDY